MRSRSRRFPRKALPLTRDAGNMRARETRTAVVHHGYQPRVAPAIIQSIPDKSFLVKGAFSRGALEKYQFLPVSTAHISSRPSNGPSFSACVYPSSRRVRARPSPRAAGARDKRENPRRGCKTRCS